MGSFSLVVAVAQNGAIGKDNNLLWHISADLKHFKTLTLGHTVAMGRRTYESLPKKPLPHRKHLIFTHSQFDVPQGVEILSDTPSIETYVQNHLEEHIFVIGGGQIYKLLLPYCTQAYLTRVYKDFDADTFFEDLDLLEWQVVERSGRIRDQQSDLEYEFIQYRRI